MTKASLLILSLAFILSLCHCGSRNSEQFTQMDLAENLMEQFPDSSLTILASIDSESLQSNAERARYALLMSKALDKNYIDTTTFDVLQPAIDYYLEKGTPDEKLNTYFYQGRIYQNAGDKSKALLSFSKAIDLSPQISDSLTLARSYVSQAIIYKNLYDFEEGFPPILPPPPYTKI